MIMIKKYDGVYKTRGELTYTEKENSKKVRCLKHTNLVV